LNLSPHLYALDVSGYTLCGPQLSAEALASLRGIADAALAASTCAAGAQRRFAYGSGSRHYEAANVLYCWGAQAFALLEHPVLAALADSVLGDCRLNDITAFSALPVGAEAAADITTTSWHRDCPVTAEASVPGHLWFLFLLDDFTPANGATWVVPGSHRPGSRPEPECGSPWQSLDLQRFPSRLQLLGSAGDLVVMDARMIHSSGCNRSQGARRMINVGLVPEARSARLRRSHWRIAGPALQARCGPRLRRLLGADLPHLGLGEPPSVLPPGWVTA
jgi:ectoine hydroxylase-related dioxygenase (phytanoyl-CoA dioxygenase family)